MKTVHYTLTGSAPILFHNVNSMDLVKPKRHTHAEWEDSEEVFRSRLYLGENDELVLPPRVILGALKAAAQKSGIKQDGKRSTYASVIRAVVFVNEPGKFKQIYKDLTKHQEYVTVQKSKIKRIFPCLQNWEVSLKLSYDERQISLEALNDIFEYCGSYVGIGDYRPMFGRFVPVCKKM